jgi:lipopolysaccharide biosynthesis protein
MSNRTAISRVKSKLREIKRISPKHEFSSLKIDQQYTTIRRQIALLKKGNTTKMACVIHLYYTESWEALSKKLKQIKAFPFDLYVSLPSHNVLFKDIILEDFPGAFIYESPNRGRDVLPFLSIAGILYENGYSSVLKLHSKKSTHRTDGEDWFKDMIESLIPKTLDLQSLLIETLEKPNTGVIGPVNQYTSLKVNFEANGSHMTRVVKSLYSKFIAHETLQINRSKYGFFAGTMFWVRLDSILHLFKAIQARRFESETGQIDATFAHAIERLLCVIPEIEGKKMYEISTKKIEPINYSDGIIPDWSNVYIGPKPIK